MLVSPLSREKDVKMEEWIASMLTAIVGALIGWGLARLQYILTRRKEREEAVAALRFELESNVNWATDCINRKLYLRDEACLSLRGTGYISYLRKPIPQKVIECYATMYRMNHILAILKGDKPAEKGSIKESETKYLEEAKAYRNKFVEEAKTLYALLDKNYPSIGKNFE
jgi:hypothetical protein